MKKISALILSSILLVSYSPIVRAVTLADSDMSSVIQVWSYNEGEDYSYQGSGFFVDFTSGCFVTATHVITDDNDDYRESNYIVINPDTAKEELYWVTPIIAYSDADVAFLCVDDESFVKKFRHYLKFSKNTFDQMSVGDALTGIGFPSAGGDSLTAVFGKLTGFSSYIGDRDIIKTDMSVSGGISGGPVVADNKDVVGMIIGYSGENTDISYAVSADLLDYVATLAGDKLTEVLVAGGYLTIPDDCEYDDETGYFISEGLAYYNAFCSIRVNEAREKTIKNQYEHWCNGTLSDDYVFDASVSLGGEDGLTFADWREYLNDYCGVLHSDDYYNYYTPDQILGAELIKSPEFDAVYAVLLDGKRHAFYNQAIYTSWLGDDFSAVKTVSAEELAAYSLGGNVTYHPGTLIKIPSIAKVYLISDDNELRWIQDEYTAQLLYGDDWNKKIYDVPETLFGNYSIGDSISL